MTAAEKETFDGDFIRLWCRKEALAKMTGEGIVGYPSDLDTSCRRFTEQKVSFGGESYWLTDVCGDGEGDGAFFSPRPKETLDKQR
jgi:phosphopantetheinyl transferase